ncbi:MAG: cysteine desulfurase [Phycisphaerales bacterium]|nr:cysteine desulfurase [Phycisphaerales bacterium]MCB9857799.1 cysteine desulfurase [Phycisphaerales bacterium]MCB9863859.1 cysteine desulfurase [Phycisphaerales bacterium]
MIYLDYNATTPTDPAVTNAMLPFLRGQYGNPNSSHAMGRPVREAIESARTSVARLINAKPDEISFTSGGTEASNWAIKGAAFADRRRGDHMITISVEHPATLGPMQWLEKFGISHTIVGVDQHGRVDPAQIETAVQDNTILISLMHAQNEVGTLEPVAEVGAIARSRGILFHVDAAQSLGKVPVDVEAMNADLLSIAGHKLYAPKGIGALYIRSGVEIDKFIHGAGQEHGRRGGTENAAMSVGLGKAAELAIEYLSKGSHSELRDYFWQQMQATLGNRVVLNGHPTERLPSTLNVSFPGHVGGNLLAKLDGVCASTGAACHSGDAKPSRVLTAMGIDRERAIGAIRFSVGRPTTREEIDAVVKMLTQAVIAT